MIPCPVCRQVPEAWNVAVDMLKTPGVVCGCRRMRVTRHFLAVHDAPYGDHRNPGGPAFRVAVVYEDGGFHWFVSGVTPRWEFGCDATDAIAAIHELAVVAEVMRS